MSVRAGDRYHGVVVIHRSPETSRLGAFIARLPIPTVLSRFALTGVLVAVVHYSAVTALALAGTPIQAAVAIGFVLAVCTHFTLNRQWVFSSDEGYALHISHQGARYLVVAACSYAATAIGVAVLPDALGIPDLAAFFLVSAVMACVGFVVLRLWVFRAAPVPG
jgi:putative flippase GtrA